MADKIIERKRERYVRIKGSSAEQLREVAEELGPVIEKFLTADDAQVPEEVSVGEPTVDSMDSMVQLCRSETPEALLAFLQSRGIAKIPLTTLDYLPGYWELVDFMKDLEAHLRHAGSTLGVFKISEVHHLYNWHNKSLVDSLAQWLRPKAKPIVEICAGNGLLSHWLRDRGVPIVATDKDTSEDNHYTKARPAAPVEELDHLAALKKYNPQTVIACWIPYGDSLATEVLEYPSVRELVYIGESGGGCTGTEDLWDKFEHEELLPNRYVLSRTDWSFPLSTDGIWRHGTCVVFRKDAKKKDSEAPDAG